MLPNSAGGRIAPSGPPSAAASPALGDLVLEDHYAASGRRWALGAELVYGPIAADMVATSPHRLGGRTVLDAGAGTGAASAALRRCGADVLAMDLSRAMLAWQASTRPPCVVADIRALPLAAGSVDDAVAAFVLNHLADPVTGLAELARVTGSGGSILAAVFGNDSRSASRDRIDAAAHGAGWRAPAWYRALKATAAPILGTADAMAAAARAAGLADVHTEERPVDVGVTEPGQLVRYRLGHPAFAVWLDAIGPERAATIAAEAESAVGDAMAPYRPSVVFLRAIAI
jgi:SAM-dependent methyltransferase